MSSAREKIFNLPTVILCLVGALVAIEAIGQSISPRAYLDLLQHSAFVPGRFTFAFDPDRVTEAYRALAGSDEARAEIDRFFLGDGEPLWWTPLTYAFLHGGWLHVGVNSLWLVAFGSAVARRFGAARFLLFCAVSAVAGAGMHYVTHPTDLQPVVGASAVVSAAMAAAARFVFQPGAPLGDVIGFMSRDNEENYRLPAPPLREIFTNRTAMAFLGFWLLTNFIFGAFPSTMGVTDATVAWEAHIGGFLVGLLAFPWFDAPARPLPRPEPPASPRHWG